jgi:hypothetical protein
VLEREECGDEWIAAAGVSNDDIGKRDAVRDTACTQVPGIVKCASEIGFECFWSFDLALYRNGVAVADGIERVGGDEDEFAGLRVADVEVLACRAHIWLARDNSFECYLFPFARCERRLVPGR